MIEVALLGLLARVPIAGTTFDGGAAVLGIALVWLLFLDWKLALPFGLTSLGLYFLGKAIPVPSLWVVFFGGWALQFVGHFHFEKRSPSFFSNVMHLFIGPFWLFARTVGYTFDPPARS